MSNRIIREPERAAITGVGKMPWYTLEKQGKVPRRINITTRTVGWDLNEINEWVENKIAEEKAKR